MIELNCPQIIGKDSELWIKFIKRDVLTYANEQPPKPADPNNWYKLYRKLLRADQKELKASEEELRATMAGIKDSRAKKEVQWRPNHQLPPQPKVGGMIFCHEPKPKKSPPPPPKTDVLRFGAGSRTKVVTGRDMINKARRQARETALLRPGFGNLSTPSHLLNNLATKVTKAPASMTPQRLTPSNIQGPTPALSAGSPLTPTELERRRMEIAKRRNGGIEITASPSGVSPQAPAHSHRTTNFAAQQSHMSRGPTLESKTQQALIKKRAPVDPLLSAKRRRVA